MARVVISGTSCGIGLKLVQSHLKEVWRAIGVVRLRSPIDHPNECHLLHDITRGDTAIALGDCLMNLRVTQADQGDLFSRGRRAGSVGDLSAHPSLGALLRVW